MTTESARTTGGLEPPSLLGAYRFAGSLKLTLVLLAALAPAIVAAYNFEQWRSWPLAIPLTLLALNLLVALQTNPAFRRQTGLIVFHLSLVALLLLIAAGRLTYLKGTLELTEGASFEGQLTSTDAADWHFGALDKVHFTNLGFEIDYAPLIKRGETRNRVRWRDEDGRLREAVVGDQNALVVHGYRFYTSHNKGFAPIFRFDPLAGGEPLAGSVHLPAYPMHEFNQAREWTLPGTERKLWVLLDFDETILDPFEHSGFRLPGDFKLILREGEVRRELLPGDAIDFAEGRLTFVGLRAWMGYNVFYDWTLPWLAATTVLAMLSLGWHFAAKFKRKPWDA